MAICRKRQASSAVLLAVCLGLFGCVRAPSETLGIGGCYIGDYYIHTVYRYPPRRIGEAEVATDSTLRFAMIRPAASTVKISTTNGKTAKPGADVTVTPAFLFSRSQVISPEDQHRVIFLRDDGLFVPIALTPEELEQFVEMLRSNQKTGETWESKILPAIEAIRNGAEEK